MAPRSIIALVSRPDGGAYIESGQTDDDEQTKSIRHDVECAHISPSTSLMISFKRCPSSLSP
jgi:hypothetical protein